MTAKALLPATTMKFGSIWFNGSTIRRGSTEKASLGTAEVLESHHRRQKAQPQ